jgi:CRP-like cAMP-binding protein/membrane protein YdbS with pleckstrin-like domain
MTNKVDFLAGLPIFEELNEDELEDLAQIAEEYAFQDGAVIAYQRDVASALYIVRYGRLVASRVDERGAVYEPEAYEPGDYFDDVWLFVPALHPATVKTEGSGRLIIITEPNFLKFLELHPAALEKLELSEEAVDAAERSRVALPRRRYANIGLMADELIELETRRSRWRLLTMIFWPTLGLILFPTLLYGVPRLFGASTLLLAVLVILPIFIFGGLLLFQIVDWANDYFVITTRHIVHYEFDLRRFRVMLHKTPIDQIQSVEIVKPNLLQNLLNMGTVRVTTAAQEAVVYFDYVDNPEAIRTTLLRLRERVKALDASRFRSSMRTSLENYFQAVPSYTKVTEPEEEQVDPTPEGAHPLGRVTSALTGLLPHGRSRTVEGNVATYHRHWIVVIFRTWRVGLITLGLALGAIFSLLWLQVAFLFVIFAAAGFLTTLWLLWKYEDWRNDIYQVTDRYVIDIDRRPFGFGESRKQAELGNVQNINARREGLTATLFNYGHVHIETAGAQADIVFEYVSNPNRVQAEIFNRRQQFRQRQRALEEQQRRQEYAVLLDVFQEASEQDRIPRRTPGKGE